MKSIFIVGMMVLSIMLLHHIISLVRFTTPEITFVNKEVDVTNYEAEKLGHVLSPGREFYIKYQFRQTKYTEGLFVKTKIDTMQSQMWKRDEPKY